MANSSRAKSHVNQDKKSLELFAEICEHIAREISEEFLQGMFLENL